VESVEGWRAWRGEGVRAWRGGGVEGWRGGGVEEEVCWLHTTPRTFVGCTLHHAPLLAGLRLALDRSNCLHHLHGFSIVCGGRREDACQISTAYSSTDYAH
jgi:hypothetical protein